MAIFVALAVGSAACLSPPPQPAAMNAASARARGPGNLERRQVMGRHSLRMWAGLGEELPATILHRNRTAEKEAGVAEGRMSPLLLTCATRCHPERSEGSGRWCV